MRVTSSIPCGAPWLVDVLPTGGGLDPGQTDRLVARINPAGLASGTYRGAVCLSTSGDSPQRLAVPVTLTIP